MSASTEPSIMQPKKKRWVYSEENRRWCLDTVKDCDGNVQAALKIINQVSGFEKIKKKNIQTWEKLNGKVIRKGGRKINSNFEREVNEYLIVSTLTKYKSEEEEPTKISLKLSYGMIIAAAKLIYQKNYKDDPIVSQIIFSNKWVHGFLKRHSLVKRKITSDCTVARDTEVIKEFVKEISKHCENALVVNIDETAIMFHNRPSHCFVENNQTNGVSILPTSKKRITVTLGVCHTGKLLPPLMIVKGIDSKKKMEKLKNKVLVNGSDWEICSLETTYYLKHKESGAVIVSNQKAWMTVEVMYVYIHEILCNFQNCVILWDNFSVHKNDTVMQKLKDLNIKTLMLIPGCTAILQPLDVSINKMLKNSMRKKYINELMLCLDKYHQELTLSTINLQTHPRFKLPIFNEAKIIDHLLQIIEKEFVNDKFDKICQNTFRGIGYLEDKDNLESMDQLVDMVFDMGFSKN